MLLFNEYPKEASIPSEKMPDGNVIMVRQILIPNISQYIKVAKLMR